MVIIQGDPPPPFSEVRNPKSNDGIRDPGAGIREDPVLERDREARKASGGSCSRRLLRGCAPRNDNIGLGSRIPYPGSRIFRYAHDLSNLRITQQIVDLLYREGLRRIAVGVDRAQEAERFGAGVHELMRDIRRDVHKVKRRDVEHLAADHRPAGAADDDDGMNVTVLLQTRISARLNLKVAKLKRHRLARPPGQGMARYVPPCGARCRGPAEFVNPRAHPIPRFAVELAMPPAVRRRPAGYPAAAVFRMLAHGRTTTFSASVASRTSRYPSAAPSRE